MAIHIAYDYVHTHYNDIRRHRPLAVQRTRSPSLTPTVPDATDITTFPVPAAAAITAVPVPAATVAAALEAAAGALSEDSAADRAAAAAAEEDAARRLRVEVEEAEIRLRVESTIAPVTPPRPGRIPPRVWFQWQGESGGRECWIGGRRGKGGGGGR